MAAVKLNGKWGFIDKTGKEVIPCEYYWATDFHEGLAKVGEGRYIDKKGKIVIELKCVTSSDFKEGLALVHLPGDQNKFIFIDKTGKQAIPDSYYDVKGGFKEGKVLVKPTPAQNWVFIDKTGKEVFTSNYQRVGDFHEGMAVTLVNQDFMGHGGKYGYVGYRSKPE